MQFTATFVSLSLALLAAAGPIDIRAAFTLDNGKDAQALNAKFAGLSASSSCTPGENACVNGAFAQCVDGKFVLAPCAGGLTCVALPLVNSKGTSITCDTEADALTRISNTGATGGLNGRSIEGRASFTLQNGKDAQALNAKFATLSKTSSCTPGQNACVDGQFAQCVNGQFVLSPCSGGTQCVALPLVLSAGTSITCDTEADAIQRIANTGATGGLAGKRELTARDATAPAACASKRRRDLSTRSPGGIAKRIAQTDLPQVAQQWQDLCLASGGDTSAANGNPCVQLAGVDGINALLANGDICLQQDVADKMVDFAKGSGINNKDALIKFAQTYLAHPRNALNINGVVPSTPFCQKAVKNSELKGIFHKQLDGVDKGLFGNPSLGVFAFGDPRTCPFGQSPNVNSCSCE